MSELAARAIEDARSRAFARRRRANDSCAAWILETAHLFPDDDFEDFLHTRLHLIEADRVTFRAFRAELIEERAAA